MWKEVLQQWASDLDRWTSVPVSLGYLAVLLLVVAGYQLTNRAIIPPLSTDDSTTSTTRGDNHAAKSTSAAEEDLPDPPRNFTAQQLRYFNGEKDEKTGQDKPVYLSVKGTVFDVSRGRDFYGPGGPYATFAGRECGVALAKMSFDEALLDDVVACHTLNFGEQAELAGWIEKFTYYRLYPIMGKLVPAALMPDPERELTREELSSYDGTQAVPEGYAAAPIYVGAKDKVFDVSFGGIGFYGKGGPYAKFAGRDASRALALVNLDEANILNNSLEGLTEKQLTTLDDWVKSFQEKKGYPVVGKLSSN